MKRSVFEKKMAEAGDAYIYYNSPVSKKQKYHIGTLDLLACQYTADKFKTKNHSEVRDGQIKVFCWDLDDFKNIETDYIYKVVPLAEVLRGRDF
jgi:hypothetical protein